MIILIQNSFSPGENTAFKEEVEFYSIPCDETVDAYDRGRHNYIDKYSICAVPCLLKVEERDGLLERTDYEADINKIGNFKERNAL